MALKETHLNGKIIVEQITYYVYNSKEERGKDHYYLSTSSLDKAKEACYH